MKWAMQKGLLAQGALPPDARSHSLTLSAEALGLSPAVVANGTGVRTVKKKPYKNSTLRQH